MLDCVNQGLEDTLSVGVRPGEAQTKHPGHLGLQQVQRGTREGPKPAKIMLQNHKMFTKIMPDRNVFMFNWNQTNQN